MLFMRISSQSINIFFIDYIYFNKDISRHFKIILNPETEFDVGIFFINIEISIKFLIYDVITLTFPYRYFIPVFIEIIRNKKSEFFLWFHIYINFIIHFFICFIYIIMVIMRIRIVYFDIKFLIIIIGYYIKFI